jgi:hypothetical protein
VYLHNISFKAVPFGSDILLIFVRLLGNNFSVLFAMTSLALANRCPFRTFLVMETGESWVATSSLLQRRCVIELGKVLFNHNDMCRCIMQKKPAISCAFFQMFLSHCIPDMMEDFDIHFFVYSMPLWNKFVVDEILSIKENLQCNFVLAFVEVQFLFLRGCFQFPLT